jgi:hypothetical protein
MGMTTVLPQQRLLLELLVMSGDIAVNEEDGDSMLWRTLKECEENGWTKLETVSQEFHSVSITEAGRKAIG